MPGFFEPPLSWRGLQLGGNLCQQRHMGAAHAEDLEGVVHRDAGEPVALEALIGLAEGAGDIGGGHADAQRFLGHRDTGQGE